MAEALGTGGDDNQTTDRFLRLCLRYPWEDGALEEASALARSGTGIA